MITKTDIEEFDKKLINKELTVLLVKKLLDKCTTKEDKELMSDKMSMYTDFIYYFEERKEKENEIEKIFKKMDRLEFTTDEKALRTKKWMDILRKEIDEELKSAEGYSDKLLIVSRVYTRAKAIERLIEVYEDYVDSLL